MALEKPKRKCYQVVGNVEGVYAFLNGNVTIIKGCRKGETRAPSSYKARALKFDDLPENFLRPFQDRPGWSVTFELPLEFLR